ncbi:hypothetical protein D8674_006531 [Pyrus ussuriensis x Pyrus communis]|uniref:Uncharacterized protein n=1 Tax=Pyrus ussuriensis x Pyrus communis TaxID=2448454 RepID=A0A5N5G859_9ROSA|nr:hypothetical protein D8674_006531 [Pyrus ussuriensis x Pyrus communis]
MLCDKCFTHKHFYSASYNVFVRSHCSLETAPEFYGQFLVTGAGEHTSFFLFLQAQGSDLGWRRIQNQRCEIEDDFEGLGFAGIQGILEDFLNLFDLV